MSYELESASQLYDTQQYLTHKIKGQTPTDDRYLFGMRVESFGEFNFGAFSAGQKKRVVLAQEGIVTPISLKSIYAFAANPVRDEISIRLFSDNTEIGQLRFTSNSVPYQFPHGAIIEPNLSIEVTARYSMNQLMIYWQPVHRIKYSVID